MIQRVDNMLSLKSKTLVNVVETINRLAMRKAAEGARMFPDETTSF